MKVSSIFEYFPYYVDLVRLLDIKKSSRFNLEPIGIKRYTSTISQGLYEFQP